MSDIVCLRCGLINDYRVIPSGPHLKAICNGCDKYIKFLSKTQSLNNNQKQNKMSQGFYGSIAIEDLFTGKIATGSNGKKYVCLDDLNTEPFKHAKNNKHYVSIGTWINDDIDEFGNIGSISLSQSMPEREQKVKKVYIGNLRRSGEGIAKAAAPPAADAAGPQAAAYNDLPF